MPFDAPRTLGLASSGRLSSLPAVSPFSHHAATFAAAHKRWQDAIGYSRRALARETMGRPTQNLFEALALLETGEAAKAQELVDEVLPQSPDDPYTLFLSARIRRSLNDYAREAESLKARCHWAKAGISTANYRIYLGQAYARQSLPEPALQNYRAALNSGQLDAKQAESRFRMPINSIESKELPEDPTGFSLCSRGITISNVF